MNNRRAYLIIFFTLFLFTGFSVSAQKVPESMVNAFSKGDVEVLSNFFHDRLNVNIIEQEFMCSKAQAKEIMREFFSKNKPATFKVIIEGGKSDSNYSIGILTTSTGKYRVNIFFKKIGEKNLVHLLRIEKDDGRYF